MITNLSYFLFLGMLAGDSWPPPEEFLDCLKLMDMESSEEEEMVAEEKAKVKEDAAEEDDTDASSSEDTSEKPTIHSEL